MSEQLLVQQLDSCAELVKITKETLRLNILFRELEPIHFSLEATPTSLPISPSLQVRSLLFSSFISALCTISTLGART